jgi:hypothetical protein
LRRVLINHANRTTRFQHVYHKIFLSQNLARINILALRWKHVRLGIAIIRPELKTARNIFLTLVIFPLCAGFAVAQHQSLNDDGGWVLALEKAWNHALEAEDAKALDLILTNTFVSIEIDGILLALHRCLSF